MDFTAFALSQLPPPPARVLEVGCGADGGVAPALAAAGYDVLAIDPRAPEGPVFRQVTLEELDDPGPFAAVVAGRVLHHVDPLPRALDKVARLGPLLVVDEFASDRVGGAAQEWYEAQHRILVAAGAEPPGPPDLDRWRAEHPDLHPYAVLRRELDARYEERFFEWRPYLYRWLGTATSEALETALISAGAIEPLGFRYVGVLRDGNP